MCHHYKGSRQPPEHLRDEFSLRSNLYQLPLPEAGFYPLASVPIVRLDETGEREMVAVPEPYAATQWFGGTLFLGMR